MAIEGAHLRSFAPVSPSVVCSSEVHSGATIRVGGAEPARAQASK